MASRLRTGSATLFTGGSTLLTGGATLVALAVLLALDFSLETIVPDSALRQLLMLAAVYVMVAVSLNVINGMAGQFSIGHPGFVGIGAYTAAVVASLVHGDSTLAYLHRKARRWFHFGGHLEDDATLAGAALREATEESGSTTCSSTPSRCTSRRTRSSSATRAGRAPPRRALPGPHRVPTSSRR